MGLPKSPDQTIQLRLEAQQNPVADPVSAITAVVRPILVGTLHALQLDRVERLGGYESITLRDLAREYRAGDGDVGISFEYAVHDAVGRADPMVLNRVEDVLTKFCRIKGETISSILFGAEKSGSQRLIDTASELLTPESRLMVGARGQPVLLRRHIERAARAFRSRDERELLPESIRGLWKADLFLGRHDTDRWVATTVKINPGHLERAAGLRVGIVPARGMGDAPYMDDAKNLIVCPLLHDGDFMEVFYAGWGVVQTVIAADAKMPKPVALPRADQRQVAQRLVERAGFPLVQIIEALATIEQPHLLLEDTKEASLITPDLKAGRSRVEIGGLLAPVAKTGGASSTVVGGGSQAIETRIAEALAASSQPALEVSVVIGGLGPSGIGRGRISIRIRNTSERPAHEIEMEARRVDQPNAWRGQLPLLEADAVHDFAAGMGQAMDALAPARLFSEIRVRFADAFDFARYELRWGEPDWQATTRRLA